LALAGELNGCFAVFRSADGRLSACVDRLRTVPLFYIDTPNGVLVADTAGALRGLLTNACIEPEAAAEFRLTGYVTGAGTLVRGLMQVPAGHALFDEPGVGSRRHLVRYYAFKHHEFSTQNDDVLVEALNATHERVFRRLLADVGDRQIVVPLSGGYDSRLIGVMLRDLGHRDVLCYTYGIEGNWESKISKELAAYLGFRWIMVPYSGQQWRQWATIPAFGEYFREAGNLSAVSHVQDWPAVYELQRRGEIRNDAVFVPGHSGDFLAGSHVPKWYASRPTLSRDEILQSLFDSHYSLWDWPRRDGDALRNALAARIEDITGAIADSTPEVAADIFERWDCQERQAKFIVNSIRVYESFGHEWRLPLFDAELMDFWSHIRVDHRIGRKLYFKFADERQNLPITRPNTDRSPLVAGVFRLINASALRPLAKRAQQRVQRARWKQRYDCGELGWFNVFEQDDFKARYTGREIGHSFFAHKYLKDIGG
jgi:asparagine synthase (glutamine-hydrolysing)